MSGVRAGARRSVPDGHVSNARSRRAEPAEPRRASRSVGRSARRAATRCAAAPEWWLPRIDPRLVGAQFDAVVSDAFGGVSPYMADGAKIATDPPDADVLRMGANAWAGQAFTDPEDCGYVFQGYALPLHDPFENRMFDAAHCSSASALGYHVNTASTHTVKVAGRWRMYIPEPRVAADEPSEATAWLPWPRSLPDATTATPVERYPDDWSDSSPRFSANYISFVDSPDGSLTFPVYAPIVPVKALDTAGCAAEFATEYAIWTKAGWTPTAIPSRNEATDVAVDGLYTIYRDPSVIDLFASYGLYLMIVVECRSTAATPEEVTTCHPCIHSSTDGCDTYAYTRIVLFASTSPDFPEVTALDGTWPDPKNWTRAVVLLDGGGDPVAGTIPDENYGVPSVTLSPDGNYLLLYAGIGPPDTSDPLWAPSRIAARYGPRPPPLGTGLSGFAISLSNLMYALGNIEYWEAVGVEQFAEEARSTITAVVDASYQGEVVLSTGELDAPGAKFHQLQNLDPQFTLIGGQVWAHFVATDSAECPDADPPVGNDCAREVHQVRRARAITVTPTTTAPQGFSDDACDLLNDGRMISPQTPFALFRSPDRCFKLLDMNALIGAVGFGLTRDPDVAELDDGTIRISFAGASSAEAGANIGQGLMFASHAPAIQVGKPYFGGGLLK